MKKIFYLFLLLCYSGILSAQSTFRTNISVQYKNHDSYNYGFSAISLSDGSYIIAGRSDSGYKTSNIFLSKLNNHGNLVWTKLIRTNKYDETPPVYIISTKDTGFAVCTTVDTKITLFKFNKNAKLQWSKDFNDSNYYGSGGFGIIQTTDGGFMISGAVIFNKNKTKYTSCLFKTNASGNVVWSKRYFLNGNSLITDIKSTSDKKFIFVADVSNSNGSVDSLFIVKINNNGDLIWSKVYTDSKSNSHYGKVFVGDDKSIIVSGGGYLKSNDKGFGVLLKLDKNGNLKWSKTTETKHEDISLSNIIATSKNEYVFGGMSIKDFQIQYYLLLKVNTNGKLIWSKAMHAGYDNYPELNSIIISNDNGYLGVGDDDGGEIITVKFDSDFNSCIGAQDITSIKNSNTVSDKAVNTEIGNMEVFEIVNYSITPAGTATNYCYEPGLKNIEFANEQHVISSLENPFVIAFPNPVKDILILHFREGTNENKSIIISSIDGKDLKKIDGLHTDLKNNISIPVSGLSKGAYFISVIGKNDKQVLKVVKQ